MNQVLEDFIYSLETMDTGDLANHALDDVWLAELSDDELIAVIHEMVKRLPDDDDDFYADEWDEVYDEEMEYE